MQATYCELWSSQTRSPTNVLSEAAARECDARGKLYCVVLGDPMSPQAVLDIAWENSHLSVSFIDDEGRTHTQYLFQKMKNGKLFMHEATVWSYDKGAENMSGAHHIESAEFRPDGYASRTIDDISSDQIEKTEYRDVPVDDNWEPVPGFGQWESVARYDRDAPAGA